MTFQTTSKLPKKQPNLCKSYPKTVEIIDDNKRAYNVPIQRNISWSIICRILYKQTIPFVLGQCVVYFSIKCSVAVVINFHLAIILTLLIYLYCNPRTKRYTHYSEEEKNSVDNFMHTNRIKEQNSCVPS